MKLIDDWKTVLMHAWSVWLMWVAILLDVAQQVLPFLAEIIPWWVSVGIVAGAIVARLIHQDLDKHEQA